MTSVTNKDPCPCLSRIRVESTPRAYRPGPGPDPIPLPNFWMELLALIGQRKILVTLLHKVLQAKAAWLDSGPIGICIHCLTTPHSFLSAVIQSPFAFCFSSHHLYCSLIDEFLLLPTVTLKLTDLKKCQSCVEG